MSLLHGKFWSSLGGAVILTAVLSACRTTPAPPVEQKNDPVAEVSGKVLSLQKQLRERDKRIEELESQLNTLKLIDQDLTKQRSSIRPPVTLTPGR